MPQDPISLYNFYTQYDWQAADFTGLQTGLYNTIEGGREKRGIHYGLQCVPPGSGLNLTVKSGVATNSLGRLLYLANDATVAITSPSGNPGWNLIVLRPVDTNANNIPNPVNPLSNVPLNVQRTAQVVQIVGTPSGSPSYPSVQTGDIILMGLKLTNGQSNLTASSFDFSQRNTRHQQEKILVKATSNYSIAVGDQIIEVDASGGPVTLTLPDVNLSQCREFTVVKVDSSANAVTCGTISGQSVQLLSQYDFISFYSNGLTFNQKG